MSRTSSHVQTLFVSAGVFALAVSARPIVDPGVLTQMGSQAQQVSFDLLSHIHNSLTHATGASADSAAAAKDESIDDIDSKPRHDASSTGANVLDRLIKLAGQAPAALVQSWTASHGRGAAASVQSTGENDDTTIFVFTSDAHEVEVVEQPKLSHIIVPPGSAATPMEVVFTDHPLSPVAPENAVITIDELLPVPLKTEQPATGKTFAQVSPYLAPAMLALLSLGVVLALVAVYHALGMTSRKVTPADLESSAPGDSKPSGDEKEKKAIVATDEEKAAAQLAERIIALMPPPTLKPRIRPAHLVPLPMEDDAIELSASNIVSRMPSPYMTPRQLSSEEQQEYFPDPEELELLIDVAAQTLPRLSTAMPGTLDPQLLDIPSISLEDVSGIVRATGPDPVLPLQVALLFPYLNDGWVLKFFVVLFGWWSVVLSPRNSFA